jgi:deoxyribodipyrimidine photo-lyase
VGPINIFWFRRDLRIDDNAGLYHALSAGLPVLPVFVFDRLILDKLENKRDKRLSFIHHILAGIKEHFEVAGSDLRVFYGTPLDAFRTLIAEYPVAGVYCNHDYEPYALDRDNEVRMLLESENILFKTFKDQVIFEKDEVVKADGTPYTVFTPYMKQWRRRFSESPPVEYPSGQLPGKLAKVASTPMPSHGSMGFSALPVGDIPGREISEDLLRHYHETRDYPALNGTSRLGIHLRFGTVSIRKVVEAGRANEVFLNELIWREFYMMILWHFPHVTERSFRPAYDRIAWRNDAGDIEAWMDGLTGYPMVDAGMRQLNATGYMHNRLRMITASFLVKHLLVDWRIGEKYFADRLLDYELASNNGGWQWAAGTGCDAAPWFRIFNPAIQQKKFDPDGKYVKRWVTGAGPYPAPVVEHAFARERALRTFKAYLNN